MSNVGSTVSPDSFLKQRKRVPNYDPYSENQRKFNNSKTEYQTPNLIQGLPHELQENNAPKPLAGCTFIGCIQPGCTQNNCLPINYQDIGTLYQFIDDTCLGSTSGPCTLWHDFFFREAAMSVINNIFCTLNNFACTTPGKCVIDFFTGSTSGLCSGDLNPEKRDCAVKAFLQQSALPPFPSSFVTETVSNAILGFSSRSIAYTYLPVFVLFFLAIWIMVAVGWIGIGAGILFSIGLIVILYFFFVSYRSSFEVYVNSNITSIDAEVKSYTSALNASLPKIPGAVASALCAYTGNCFGCTGGLPECTGCTGSSGENGDVFVGGCKPCYKGNREEVIYNE